MRFLTKQRTQAAAVAMTGVVLMSACGSTTPANDGKGEDSGDAGSLAEMDPVTLTVSDSNPETSSNGVALTDWMDYVTEETDGKVTFETYFSGTLHDGSDALSALEQGLTDITFFAPALFPDQLPVANWVSSTFAAEGTAGFPHSALANSVATASLYEESEDLRNEFAQYNAIPLVTWGSGTNDILCTSPVDSLESASGNLVNTFGEPWISEVAALGMTGEVIETPEEYEALQRGVIDCTISTTSPLMTRGTWEVAKYYTPINLSPALASGYLFNQEVWGELPLEVRQIMHDGKSRIISDFQQTSHERYAEFAEEAPEIDVEFLDPSELNTALESYHQESAAEVADSAPASVTGPQDTFDLFSTQMDNSVSTLVENLGIEQVEKTPENLQELYLSVRDINWEDYQTAVQEALDPYRPE